MRIRPYSIDRKVPPAYPCRPSLGRVKNPPMQIPAHSSRATSLKPRWHPNETNISAQQNQAGSHAWIPGADGDEGRPSRIEAPTRQGPGEAHAIAQPLPTNRATERKATTGISADCRFRRAQRLVDQHSFSRVFKKAERSRDKMFTVLYRPNGSDEPRLGLAIGKKNCRQSTGRNRLKRVVRESFRQRRRDLGGVDLVVLNQPAAARASNKALFESLDLHWDRVSASDGGPSGKGQHG